MRCSTLSPLCPWRDNRDELSGVYMPRQRAAVRQQASRLSISVCGYTLHPCCGRSVAAAGTQRRILCAASAPLLVSVCFQQREAQHSLAQRKLNEHTPSMIGGVILAITAATCPPLAYARCCGGESLRRSPCGPETRTQAPLVRRQEMQLVSHLASRAPPLRQARTPE